MSSMRAKINSGAKLAEIKRRYAWQARSKNSESKKPDRGRLLTLVRMRELERVFQHRYGRFLPDDDSGVDDFTLMANHIVQLPGDAHPRIVAWARAWAPWMSPTKAGDLARRVMENPLRFTADVLAWRLRLSMADRTALSITTIGAFDLSKAERDEDRKRRDRERKRVSRAKNRSGRPRGRPRKERNFAPIEINDLREVKNASAPVRAIAADGFSDRTTTDNRTCRTTPAIAGTPHKAIRLKGADGEAGVGNGNRQRKTRFPTSLRLNRQMAAFAVERGFNLNAIGNMFEHFRNWNLAMRSYSTDWTEVWATWVEREVDIVNERQDLQHRQTHFERMAS